MTFKHPAVSAHDWQRLKRHSKAKRSAPAYSQALCQITEVVRRIVYGRFRSGYQTQDYRHFHKTFNLSQMTFKHPTVSAHDWLKQNRNPTKKMELDNLKGFQNSDRFKWKNNKKSHNYRHTKWRLSLISSTGHAPKYKSVWETKLHMRTNF